VVVGSERIYMYKWQTFPSEIGDDLLPANVKDGGRWLINAS